LQSIKQFLPSGVLFLRSRQRVEVSRLNLVHQFDRLAFSRNQVVPAPRDHEPIRQPQNAVSDRVAMVMIIEKPSVNIALAQRVLDGRKIHRYEGLFYTTASVGRTLLSAAVDVLKQP